ncbi:MAG: hypothetical protein ORN83_05610, partial [Chthoniobacteraceae bacterium]|nr:hypothetical protein [Chthoniobacteraceae bacterium]
FKERKDTVSFNVARLTVRPLEESVVSLQHGFGLVHDSIQNRRASVFSEQQACVSERLQGLPAFHKVVAQQKLDLAVGCWAKSVDSRIKEPEAVSGVIDYSMP